MKSLEEIFNEKLKKEKAEIQREIRKDTLLADLTDMEKELKMWRNWIVANNGNLKKKEVAETLRIATELRSELMLIGVEF